MTEESKGRLLQSDGRRASASPPAPKPASSFLGASTTVGKPRHWIHLLWGCLLPILCLSALIGCSTTDDENEEPVTNARPEAFAAEGFAIQKSAPYREERANSMPFFHKQCQSRGEPSYFSKTSYLCDDRAL